MTLTRLEKAPFPYFGGSTHCAPLVWEALGDPSHYVDPFCGSLAVPLLRPALANRTYYSETVNDADGLLANALRAIAYSPDATADAASWYVCEADLSARQLAILAWARAGNLERLAADPLYHDPVIGGWWIWGMCGWIGSGWCSGDGPWVVGADGRLTKRPKRGGINRQRPHLGDNGQGVNRPQAREPGVSRKLPHLGDNGQGVNRPQAREPGVSRQRPHLGNNGQGVNHAGTRAPGVADDEMDFHPMTMPEVRRWFQFLSARLRHVRIVNGDWRRVLTPGASLTLKVRMGNATGDDVCGVFLDPPYANAERAGGLYIHDDGSVAAEARAWCAKNGSNPKYRIVLKGFAGEGHEALTALGWREVAWFQPGFLRGGMAQQSADGHQQDRERLWLSPHCLVTSAEAQPELPPMFALWDDE